MSYVIERGPDADGSYTQVATTLAGATSISVTGLVDDVIVWFRVIAVNGSGTRSAPSTPASVVPGGAAPAASVTETAERSAPLTVRAGEFEATIPPGTVDHPTAVTVTPLAPVDGVLPAVDVHIHGAWNPAAGGVKVKMPFPFAADTSPVVFHDDDGEMIIATGSSVDVAGSGTNRSVEVTATSLSPFFTGPVICTNGGLQLLDLGCIDRIGTASYRSRIAIQDAINAHIAGDQTARPCGDPLGNSAAVGAPHGALRCNGLGSNGQFRFRNTSADGAAVAPVVVDVVATDGDGPAPVSNDQKVPWMLERLAQASGTSSIYPGATLQIDKPSDPNETVLVTETNQDKSLVAGFLLVLNGAVSNALMDRGNVTEALTAQLQGCTALTDTVKALDCFRAILLENTDSILQAAALKWGRGDWLQLASTAKNFLKWVVVGEVVATFIRSFDTDRSTTYLINSAPTQRPATDQRSSWIARNPDNGRAVLVDGTRIRPIVDGGAFLCLAASRWVWDIPTLSALRTATSEPAACSTSAEGDWDVHRDDPNVGRNVLLRNTDGAAWLINDRGERQNVPDGGTYKCLAYTNPVIWNVPQSRIEEWPVGTPATCADNPLGLTARVVNTPLQSFLLSWTATAGATRYEVELTGVNSSGTTCRVVTQSFTTAPGSYPAGFTIPKPSDICWLLVTSRSTTARIRAGYGDTWGPWSGPVTFIPSA